MPQDRNENRRRQRILGLPVNGSWGPNQEKMWQDHVNAVTTLPEVVVTPSVYTFNAAMNLFDQQHLNEITERERRLGEVTKINNDLNKVGAGVLAGGAILPFIAPQAAGIGLNAAKTGLTTLAKLPYVPGAMVDKAALSLGAKATGSYMGASTLAGGMTNALVDSYFAASGLNNLYHNGPGKYGQNILVAGLGLLPFTGVRRSDVSKLYNNETRNISRKLHRATHQFERRLPYRRAERVNNLFKHYENQNDVVRFSIGAKSNSAQDILDKEYYMKNGYKRNRIKNQYISGDYTDPFTARTFHYENSPESSLNFSLGQREAPLFFAPLNPKPFMNARGDEYIGLPDDLIVYRTAKIRQPLLTDRRGDTGALRKGTTEYLHNLEEHLGVPINPSGSTVLASHGMLNDIPGDVELFVTKSELEPIAQRLGITEKAFTDSRGLTKITGFSKYGAGKQKSFDLDVVDAGPNGNAFGKLAHEIYAALHPEEYAKLNTARTQKIVNTGGYQQLSEEQKKLLQSLQNNHKDATFDWELPITPEQLLAEYRQGNNALKVQIMNAISSGKDKHVTRAEQLLTYPEASKIYRDAVVSKGKSYIPGYQSVIEAYPNIKFDNVEANKALLKELNIDEKYASDPDFMHSLAEKMHLDRIHGRNIDAQITGKADYGKKLKSGEIWDINKNLFTNSASQTASGGGGNHVFGTSGGPRFGNIGIVKQKNFNSNDINTPFDLYNKGMREVSESILSDKDLIEINTIFKKYNIPELRKGSTINDMDKAFVRKDPELKSKIGKEIAEKTDINGYNNLDSYTDEGGYYGTYYDKPNNYGLGLHSYKSDAFELSPSHIVNRKNNLYDEDLFKSYATKDEFDLNSISINSLLTTSQEEMVIWNSLTRQQQRHYLKAAKGIFAQAVFKARLDNLPLANKLFQDIQRKRIKAILEITKRTGQYMPVQTAAQKDLLKYVVPYRIARTNYYLTHPWTFISDNPKAFIGVGGTGGLGYLGYKALSEAEEENNNND